MNLAISLARKGAMSNMKPTPIDPIQARFTNTVKNTIKNSFLMALSHLPSAILFVVSYAIPVLLVYFFPQTIPVVFLSACGLLIYLKSFLFLKIFKKYEPDTEENNQEEESGEGIFAVSEAMEKMSENNNNLVKEAV